MGSSHFKGSIVFYDIQWETGFWLLCGVMILLNRGLPVPVVKLVVFLALLYLLLDFLVFLWRSKVYIIFRTQKQILCMLIGNVIFFRAAQFKALG